MRLQFTSFTLGSPFSITTEINVLFHEGLLAVLLKAFGTESIKHLSSSIQLKSSVCMCERWKPLLH